VEACSSQSSRTGSSSRVASVYLFSRYAYRAALPDSGSRGPASLSFRSKKMAVSFEWYCDPLTGYRELVVVTALANASVLGSALVPRVLLESSMIGPTALRSLAILVLYGSFMMIPAEQFTSSQSSLAMPYPNDSEGLRQFLNDMLSAAKKNDRVHLQSMIRETEIPNYENWFTTNFGGAKGENWAEPYGGRLAKNEETFEDLMVQLAHTDGEFAIVRSGVTRKYDVRNNPLDGYRADWKMPKMTNGEGAVSIADFFFIEGKFRWDSTVSYAPFQKLQSSIGGPTNHGTLPTCSYMPFPSYTNEAKAAKIRGSILIEGIVERDGRIRKMRVIRGLGYGLDESALKAMDKWRCSPVIGPDGKPVPTKVPFEINFQSY